MSKRKSRSEMGLLNTLQEGILEAMRSVSVSQDGTGSTGGTGSAAANAGSGADDTTDSGSGSSRTAAATASSAAGMKKNPIPQSQDSFVIKCDSDCISHIAKLGVCLTCAGLKLQTTPCKRFTNILFSLIFVQVAQCREGLQWEGHQARPAATPRLGMCPTLRVFRLGGRCRDDEWMDGWLFGFFSIFVGLGQ